MITQILLINAGLLLAYMSLWFVIARSRQRLDTVDTAWGLGYVLVAWAVVIQEPNTISFLIACLVSVWGLRLANHIWRRSLKHDEDPRYVELSSKWRGNLWLRAYFSIFLLQGVLIWAISLPIVMASNPALIGWGWLVLLGSLVWLKGFCIEALADRQLRQFLSNKNRPKVLQTGLWRYSRHPNYFGELTQWWGIGIIACQVSYGWVGLFGPTILSILIIFVTGIPPIEKRRLKDPEYKEYKRRTSPLILWPPKS
ncbi:MAG: DUF1295 domain-containing protein [Patescibacteria group bacterium]